MKRRDFIFKGSAGFLGAILSTLPFSFLKAKDNKLTPINKPDPSAWKDDEINIAWIGHATVLINFFGKIILTDPVFYERVGVYLLGFTFGPSRYTHPALTIDEIPKPDLVLLSHAHMDHMDYETLLDLTNMFPNQLECVTAYNTMDVITDLKWKTIQEIDWNESTEVSDIDLKALEVKHFGWRYPWEKDRSRGYMEDGRSYNAYIISYKGKKILFGGDTAYTDKFLPLKDEKIEVAIMPIGAYRPWKWNHCNPEEALIMSEYYIGTRYFVPIHCKTFKQGTEPLDEPLRWLNESAGNYDLKLGLKDIGETFTLAESNI